MNAAIAVTEPACRTCHVRPQEHRDAEMCHPCLASEMTGPTVAHIDLLDNYHLAFKELDGQLVLYIDQVTDAVEITGLPKHFTRFFMDQGFGFQVATTGRN